MSEFRRLVRQWATSERPEAPLIVRGPVEVDWELWERSMTMAGFCQVDPMGCKACSDCRNVQKGTHPDVIRLNDDEKTIKIEQVREARAQWSVTPFGQRRIIIIPQADRLTLQSSNALLKELEEGTVYNRFLLWTSFAGRLPVTIRSRSQLLRLTGEFVSQKRKGTLLWEEVVNWKRKQPFSAAELDTIYVHLQEIMERQGISASWYRASLRLRDYYQIMSGQGNTKMATDVLLASLDELR